jgi:hypothetical protein
VADENQFSTIPGMPDDLKVHFGHERAGRIKDRKAAPIGLRADRLRHPMRAEDNGRTCRHIVEFFHKYGTESTQTIDHIAIVHDFVAHIDRSTEQFDCTLDDLNRAFDTSTESARISEMNSHQDLG